MNLPLLIFYFNALVTICTVLIILLNINFWMTVIWLAIAMPINGYAYVKIEEGLST